MQSIMQKITTLGQAFVHRLLDQGIEAMSIDVLRVHARELEEATDRVADDAATAEGNVSYLTRQRDAKNTAIRTTQDSVDLLIGDDDPTNDDKAVPLAAKIVSLQNEVVTLDGHIAEAQRVMGELHEVHGKLEARHRQALDRIQMLESEESSAQGIEQAASALEIADTQDTKASVDNLTASIQRRSATAKARLRRAMGKVTDDAEVAVMNAQAREYITRRRAELDSQKTASSGTVTG